MNFDSLGPPNMIGQSSPFCLDWILLLQVLRCVFLPEHWTILLQVLCCVLLPQNDSGSDWSASF